MKKYSLLFVFASFFCFFELKAQVVSFTEEIQLRTEAGYEIIGELQGNTLLFKDRVNEFEVQAFNERMKEVWSKKIKLDKRNQRVLGTVSDNNQFTLFYRFRDKGETIIKAHRYDPGANLIDSTVIKNFGRLFFTPEFAFDLSEDQTKLLIYYIDKQTLLKAVSFDLTTMKLLWERNIELEEYNSIRDYVYIMTNNQGDLIYTIERDNSLSRKDDHHFTVYYYRGISGVVNRYQVPMLGKLTYDVIFEFDNINRKIVALGLFSEKNMSRALGYFSLFVPEDPRRQYKLSFRNFDDEFVSNLIGRDVEDNKGLRECNIQDLVLRQDGGMLLIGEMNRQFERRLASSGRVVMDRYNRFIIDYYYDDIFILSIHPDGKDHWSEILYKKQYSQDDDAVFSSYFLYKNPKEIRFLFNDEIRPENTVSEYILNGNGTLDRRSVLNTQNLKLRLRFRDAVQVDFNEVVIPSERRNRLRLVKIEY
jgi:hypothetical protein